MRYISVCTMCFILLNASCGELGYYGPNDQIFDGMIKVIDENKKPIENANVELLFNTTVRQEYKKGMGSSFSLIKITDTEGVVSFRENASAVGAYVTMENYWESAAGSPSNDINLRKSKDPKSRDYWEIRWHPTIVLTRKISPRPMVAGQFTDELPKFNMTRAFDCAVNDWVRPHGKGTHKDILFIYEGEAETNEQPPDGLRVPRVNYDVRLTLEFPNEGDGILPVKESEHPQSQVLLGRVAPMDGYENKVVLSAQTGKAYDATREDLAGYWFRVRSRIDPESGEIHGHYGKIRGNFSFAYSRTPDGYVGRFKFNYMFSPDEQRSMEYNGENLLPGGLWDPRGPGSR